jgi:hypothetical protein
MLKLIDGAQGLGFSLNEICNYFSEAGRNFPSLGAMVRALRNKLDDIDRHVTEVRARRRRIVKLLNEIGGYPRDAASTIDCRLSGPGI